MLCPRCGNVMGDKETSCKNCGEKVKEANVLPGVKTAADGTTTPKETQGVITPTKIKRDFVSHQVKETAKYNAVGFLTPQEYRDASQQYRKKENSWVIFIVVFLIVLVLGYGGIFVYKNIFGSKGSSVNSDTAHKAVESPEEEPSSGNSGNQVQYTYLDIGDYSIPILSRYDSFVDGSMGVSVDKKAGVQLVFTIMNDKTYSQNVSDQLVFKAELEEYGFAVQSNKEETYNGRKWLVYKGILKDTNAIYAITEFKSTSTFQVTILNIGSRTDESILTEVGESIDKAKFKQRSSGGSGNGSGGTTTPSGPSPGSVSAFK